MPTKIKSLVLPAGEAVWPKLNEIDVYQPVDKQGRPNGSQKRRYITYVRYDQATLATIKQKIVDWAKSENINAADMKLPFKKLKTKDSAGNVTGHEFVLQATSGEKKRPPIWDAKNNRLPLGVVVGGGSKIKLDVKPNYYEGFGGGINLYINGVQVLALVEGGEAKCNFEAEEGFEFDGEDAADASPFSATDTEGAKKDAYDF